MDLLYLVIGLATAPDEVYCSFYVARIEVVTILVIKQRVLQAHKPTSMETHFVSIN